MNYSGRRQPLKYCHELYIYKNTKLKQYSLYIKPQPDNDYWFHQNWYVQIFKNITNVFSSEFHQLPGHLISSFNLIFQGVVPTYSKLNKWVFLFVFTVHSYFITANSLQLLLLCKRSLKRVTIKELILKTDIDRIG